MVTFLRRLVLAVLTMVLFLNLAGCGDPEPAPVTQNPAPTVSSVSPSSVVAGGSAFTLTVNGTGFVSGATVRWNNNNRTTQFVSSTQVTASIAAGDITSAGTVQVAVMNPAPGGGASNAATFTCNNPAPAVSSLSPLSTTAGGTAFTLTVTGTNFVSGSTAAWNGANLATTFVSATQLTAAVPAANIASAGTAQVTVITAAPGGGTSTAATFTTNNPAPVVASTSPSSAAAGGGAFTLTVDGSNFVSGSTLQWNGTGLATTYVNSTQLTAPITAAQIATAGSAQVTVVNAAPGGGTSAAVTFAINAPPQSIGVTQIVSVTTAGAPGSGHSTDLSISATGRFVAFYSSATNLAANDSNNTYDIFLRDTCTGAPAGCTPATVLVSANLAGNPSNGENMLGGVSADGRYVAFSSYASDMTNDTIVFGSNITNIFLRDTCIGAPAGCTPSTRLVSLGADGQPANSTCSDAVLTPDARFVAFYSAATNMLSGDANAAPDIFLHDTCIGGPEGCTPSTALVSRTETGAQGNNASGYITFISPNGRYVGFGSYANNMVAGDTNGVADVFLRDTCIGATGCSPTTVRVSLGTDGTEPNNWSSSNGNGGGSHLPGVSADGRYVLFTTIASNLVPGDSGAGNDVFLRDTCIGASGCTPSTTLISVANDGTPSNNTLYGSISHDGRYVAFRSGATNLISGGNPTGMVFVRDTCNGVASGCTPSTVMVSVKGDGTPANSGGWTAMISGDGHYVAFRSPATNLVTGDTNGSDDIFLGLTSY